MWRIGVGRGRVSSPRLQIRVGGAASITRVVVGVEYELVGAGGDVVDATAACFAVVVAGWKTARLDSIR